MKLFRHGRLGQEQPGVLTNNNEHRDVSRFGEDFNEYFFANNGIIRLQQWMMQHPGECPIISVDRFGPPVKRPSKIVCIGLNYTDHAAESNMPLPAEPILFFKSTTAVCGPNDNIIIPPNSTKTDWEVELAVVIGRRASYINEKEALNHVAGYMLHNDYSEREYQLERSGQWVKGKSCDTFAPIGPYLATPDELKDVDNLSMWLSVNDKIMQRGNTSTMLFKVPFLISYISRFMTLLPGDIISTGTPPGVGLGMKPAPVYLCAGDIVKLGIDGLGEATQKLVAWENPSAYP